MKTYVWLLEKSFPILKALRTNVVYSQKIVIATAALFKFGRMLNDELPDDGVDDVDFSADENEFVVIDGDDRTTRFRGRPSGHPASR